MKTIDYIKSIGGITEASQVMPKEVFPILGIIGATIGVALVIVAIKRALKRPVRRPHRNRLKISPDLKKTKMPELVLIDGLRKPDENPVPFHEKTMQHVAKF